MYGKSNKTMSYKELRLKPSYETGIDSLVEDFYIPVLEVAKQYDRIAGFFSSTSLAISARGIAGLIRNNGNMRLITCPRLSPADAEMIESSVNSSDRIIEQVLKMSLDSIEDSFQNDHVAALGWMLANGYLEIKIALVYENGCLLDSEKLLSSSIMHQKVGVLYDKEGNGISFSGSNNESASGWLENIEEFKVFCSWNNGQFPYFESDVLKFDRFWNGKSSSVLIKTLPQAIAENLIEKGKDFKLEKIALERYQQNKYSAHTPHNKEKLNLFSYQKEAVQKWVDNGYNLLLEMATGCGKTRTAIGCIQTLFERTEKCFLVVISCPGNTLSMQWKADIDKLDIPVEKSIICDGTIPKWRANLEKLTKQLATGLYKRGIVYTTHQTCSSTDFISIISLCSPKISLFFIGDEVHGMGADKTQNGLLSSYEYRLGLSATPARWFDEDGTALISNFFGNASFIFTIHDALVTINPLTGKPFLVNYFYHPHFISLTDEELEKYKKISDRIVKMSGSKNEDQKEIAQLLLFQRANIEKSAENKYSELELILDEVGSNISDTIIFVSPEQKNRVLEILAHRGILAHSFTQEESTVSQQKYGGISEREFIINQFKAKRYQTLVAIKCLDEGIDIPSAKRAIVMASSTNPREYVQRIGRVIRQSANKAQAEIYDLIIEPDLNQYHDESLRKLEKKVFLKEMERVIELSENALNNIDVLKKVYKVKGAVAK